MLRCAVAAALAVLAAHAAAQDIPGLEGCTAERQMERRTGCLQSNDEFLQRSLSKLTRRAARATPPLMKMRSAAVRVWRRNATPAM